MNKGTIVCGVAAALICSGLIWAIGGRDNPGITGWETLNTSMEQAIGTSNTETTAATHGMQDQLDSVTVPSELNVDEDPAATPIPPTAGTNGKGTAPLISEEPEAQTDTTNGKVNVNTAGSAELMDLPGIGEKKAQAIIDYRNIKGSFHNLSDLGKVKGIGTKMLEKLKPLVVF